MKPKKGSYYYLIENEVEVICEAVPSKFLFWEEGNYVFKSLKEPRNLYIFTKNAFKCPNCAANRIIRLR